MVNVPEHQESLPRIDELSLIEFNPRLRSIALFRSHVHELLVTYRNILENIFDEGKKLDDADIELISKRVDIFIRDFKEVLTPHLLKREGGDSNTILNNMLNSVILLQSSAVLELNTVKKFPLIKDQEKLKTIFKVLFLRKLEEVIDTFLSEHRSESTSQFNDRTYELFSQHYEDGSVEKRVAWLGKDCLLKILEIAGQYPSIDTIIDQEEYISESYLNAHKYHAVSIFLLMRGDKKFMQRMYDFLPVQ